MNEQDSMVYFGGTIKALGDGRIGGYLVRFGDAKQTDLDGDYFSKSTDFAVDFDAEPQAAVYYNHGLDPVMGHRVLGTGTMKSTDDIGIWIEAQLKMRDEYEKAIYQMVKDGKLGWSSGTAEHLMSLKHVDGTYEITRWPLGLDASVTPTPAEPRNGAVSIKSLADTAPIEVNTDADNAPVDIEEPEDAEGETGQPEDARTASAPVPEADDGSTVNVNVNINTQEEITMSEETKAAEVAEETAVEPVKDNGEVLAAIKGLADRMTAFEAKAVNDVPVQVAAPTVIKSLGDNEQNAFAAWYKRGDTGGVKGLVTGENEITIKASNATDMNITTDADGGYAVPTGHYQGIIARMHETALYQRLGVMNIPGKGTTVNIPVDAEADGEWVATNEAADSDLDSPAIGTVVSTLVKYTKYLLMSVELLDDEDSNLLAFVEHWVGSGLGRTHNSLMITAALAGGTAGLTLDGAAAITAAEIPELMYKLKGEYADKAAWLMARATEAKVRGLTGDDFVFGPRPGGEIGVMPSLYGAPVYNSQYMPAATTGLKSMLFGNFGYMGLRQSKSISFLRNPYLLARSGQIALHYYTRIDYEVLQAEAIQYATQA